MSWRTRSIPGWSTAAVVLAALVAQGCAPAPTGEMAAGEWPQFRGPDGQGISPAENLPVRWRGVADNVRWRARVPGSGNSSPVISGGRVFLTTAYGSPEDDAVAALEHEVSQRAVLAYDLASGEKLWETVVFEGPIGARHWSNTHAAPTPVTDGRHVFVSFDAKLAALDFDGAVVWLRDVDPDYYEFSHYGVSASPVLTPEAVILLQDKEEGESGDPGWIAAFDRRNGELIWRDEWTHTCCSYNTPLVVERDRRLEVWSATAHEVTGYDARTGEKIWQGVHPTMQTVPSLVRQGDLFCAPGGIHTNAIVMFHLCPQGEGITPVPLWTSKVGAPEISSPVLYRDRLFTVTRGGAFHVWDPVSGQELWRKRLPPGGYRPSLVAGDGKVYAVNDRGVTTVIDAVSDPPRILTRNRLPNGNSASPAIADGSIFIRTQNELFRIDKEDPPFGSAQPGADDDDEAEADDEADDDAE